MIGIFVHPPAGNGKALQAAALIEKLLAEKNILFSTYRNRWPDTIAAHDQAWIVGGDGTLNYFINQYRQIDIPLVIFKGGTGNDFAWQLYGDMDIPQQVARALTAAPQLADAGICNGKLFVNSVGIGFDGEVLRSMGAIRQMGGHLGYWWVVIKKIFRFKEFYFTIHADGKQFSNKFLLVNIANASRTGGGFLISPQAKMNDGALNLVLCKPLRLLQRLRFLPVIEKGKHLQLPFITHQQIHHIQVCCSTSAFAQLDGELIQNETFNITILPGHFLFIF